MSKNGLMTIELDCTGGGQPFLRLTRGNKLKPITVDADGVILTGNWTWETAKALGWKFIARTRTDLTGVKA